MHIDCERCVMRDTDACDDCLVTFLLDRPEGAIVFDVEEERALRVLSDGGLTARVRFAPDHPSDRPPPPTALPA